MTDSTPTIDAPPTLQLEVDEPLLRMIRSMRSMLSGAPHAKDDEKQQQQQRELPKNKDRRSLRRVAVRSLQLGRQRKVVATDEVEVVAKFLYKKPRKIVCQLHNRRDGSLARIDILWSSIRAMSARFDHDDAASFDTLTIEVKSPAEQYRADRPPPRRHIQWQRCAPLTTRTFCLQFDKGTLERSYGKMLYTDPSLIPLTLPLPPPPPPPKEDEEGSQASSTVTQPTGMIAAVPASVDGLEAETTGTDDLSKFCFLPFKLNSESNIRFSNDDSAGADVATHEYGSTQSYHPSQPAHTQHPFL